MNRNEMTEELLKLSKKDLLGITQSLKEKGFFSMIGEVLNNEEIIEMCSDLGVVSSITKYDFIHYLGEDLLTDFTQSKSLEELFPINQIELFKVYLRSLGHLGDDYQHTNSIFRKVFETTPISSLFDNNRISYNRNDLFHECIGVNPNEVITILYNDFISCMDKVKEKTLLTFISEFTDEKWEDQILDFSDLEKEIKKIISYDDYNKFLIRENRNEKISEVLSTF
jgi:hypothetical protein